MAIIYVDSNAAGLNNGTSWTDAYTSLRTAVEHTDDLDEVWFTFDTPIPAGVLDGITKNILVHGGFHGTEETAEGREIWAYVRTGRFVLRTIQVA